MLTPSSVNVDSRAFEATELRAWQPSIERTWIATDPIREKDSDRAMSRLAPQFALSKRKPGELHRLAQKARASHTVLDNHEELVQRARFFQAVGHDVRLMIVGLLELEELCFCDIIEALGAPPSTVAHHLSMLEDAGVIVRKENGKFTTFRLRKDLITKHRVLQ